MNNEENSNISGLKTFTGSLDELLTHCASLDADKIENDAERELYETAINQVMLVHECSREEAISFIEEYCAKDNAELVADVLQELMANGLVESFIKDGEVLYKLTPAGELHQKNSKK